MLSFSYQSLKIKEVKPHLFKIKILLKAVSSTSGVVPKSYLKDLSLLKTQTLLGTAKATLNASL